MNRNLFSRIRRSGEPTKSMSADGEQRSISRATRIGLLIGGAVVITGSAVPAIAANTAAKSASSASSAKPAAAAGTQTKVKPVRGAKPAVRALAPILASPASASLPDSTIACPVTGTTRACDLYALAGTIAVPGIAAPLPIWGFSLGTSTNPTGPATLPGPTLVAMEGETLNVTLHNSLPTGGGNLALEIPESTGAPDLGGVAVGGVSPTPYSFAGLTPGTYIYEAGATSNGQRQVAMGLAGMLVIRPKNWSATCHNAYDESAALKCDGTSFNAESPVQLNELSTAFNTATAANPTGSDLHHYTPDVFLVNGQSFNSASPTTGSIPVNPGDDVLLRYADLGLRERSISIGSGVFDPLAVSSTSMPTGGQRELASDSKLLTVHPDLAAIYLNPVQTADTLTRVDPALAADTLVPLYDQGQHMTHWTGPSGQEKPTEGGGIGGMVAMLHVLTAGNGSPAGPKTVINVSPKVNDLNPTPADDVIVAATATSTTGSPISPSGEWFLDSPGATPNPVTSDPAACPVGSTANFCFKILEATMQSMLGAAPPINGVHVIWLHTQDAANGYGVAAGDTFSVDVSGPIISNTSVHSTPTNGNRVNDLDGSTALDIVGTASASLSGWVVTAAEVCVDAPCQTAPNLQFNPYDQAGMPHGAFATPSFGLNITAAGSGGTNDPNGPVVGINGAIPAASLPTTNGTHTFYIHACEAPVPPTTPVDSTTCGRWGDSVDTITAAPFVIDTGKPATTSLVVSPDPNNGLTSAPGNVAYLNQARVTATFDDSATGGSTIALAEVFISQPGVLPWCYTRPNLTAAELIAAQNCSSSTPTPPAGFYGTGAEMVPVGGKWNVVDTSGKGAPMTADAFIPLIDVHSFPEGHVWFWVHAKDQAGNWSDFTLASGCNKTTPANNCYELNLDKTLPILDSATATKNATNHTTDLTIKAHDPINSTPQNTVQSNIVQAEYFTSPCLGVPELETCFNDPGPGKGTAIAVPTPAYTVTLTPNIPNPPNGQALYVRVMDAAGNWSVVDFKHSVTTYP